MSEKLIICGNYGVGNLGDEAILRGLLKKFKGNEITVMSTNPKETAQKFGVKTIGMVPSGLRSLLKGIFKRRAIRLIQDAIRSCDRFILGGGTLLTDEPWRSMFVWGAQIETAFKYDKPVEIYASGIGPFKRKWAQKWAKSILEKAHRVSVRDSRSMEWTKRLGVVAKSERDPALELEGESFKTTKKIPPNTIIIAPRFWAKKADKTAKAFKKFIQYLCLKEGKKVIGIPFEKSNKEDYQFLSTIFEQAGIEGNAQIWDKYTSEKEVIAAIAKAELVVGMRLHSLIFAQLTKTPFVGVAYMEKVTGFGKDLGKEKCIVPLDGISAKTLKEAYREATK